MRPKKLIVGLLALTLLCAAVPVAADQYTGPGSNGDDLHWSTPHDWIQNLARGWETLIEWARAELDRSPSRLDPRP